jgi:hypothetical protein
MTDTAWVIVAPFIVLAVLFAVYTAATRSPNVYRLAEGLDGRTSTSKVQFLLWTVVAIGCYAAVFTANWRTGHADSSLGVPQNLMIALGISVTTAAGAKGLYLVGSTPKTTKPAAGKGGIFTDDDGRPDLAKLQLIAWTSLALAVFCVRVSEHVNATLSGGGAISTLPDIDTALLVLMGLGHAGYGATKTLERFTPATQSQLQASESALSEASWT